MIESPELLGETLAGQIEKFTAQVAAHVALWSDYVSRLSEQFEELDRGQQNRTIERTQQLTILNEAVEPLLDLARQARREPNNTTLIGQLRQRFTTMKTKLEELMRDVAEDFDE